ncbi:8699_t:CDS:2 [Diversispora eburnea]|uniref:8699_t:CDS:1 n=1 Tax=Diversispora eburnea TaxID=1213867 RepID=A0A9N9GCD9_9GLOM|nr:8699_t:CDS:2 [Diversispora eburnea]
MLKESGVLAICIDYREIFNLGKMLDEIFGEENRIAIINWQKATVNSMVKHVSVYNIDNDPLGSWVVGDPTAKDLTVNNKNIYAIQNPFTGELMYPRKNTISQGTD